MFYLIFFCAILKAVLWGIAENRLFNCNNNKALFTGAFRISLYHVWLFVFFSSLNVGFAFSLFPEWQLQIVVFAFLALWDILVLDVTWWLIRWVHFKILPFETAVKLYNGETNAWHLKTDFDSAGLPLWQGTYCWWWIISLVLIVLGFCWYLL